MFNYPYFALLVCPFGCVCSKLYKVQIHEFRVTHFWFKDIVVLVSLAAFLEALVRDHKREVELSRTKTEVSGCSFHPHVNTSSTAFLSLCCRYAQREENRKDVYRTLLELLEDAKTADELAREAGELPQSNSASGFA